MGPLLRSCVEVREPIELSFGVVTGMGLGIDVFRVTTCLENLEMSGNLKHVREMSGILLTVRELSGECQGKNLVREKCPKSVHY